MPRPVGQRDCDKDQYIAYSSRAAFQSLLLATARLKLRFTHLKMSLWIARTAVSAGRGCRSNPCGAEPARRGRGRVERGVATQTPAFAFELA